MSASMYCAVTSGLLEDYVWELWDGTASLLNCFLLVAEQKKSMGKIDQNVSGTKM